MAEGRDPGREKMRRARRSPTPSRPWSGNSSSCTAGASNRPRTIEGTQRLLDLHVLPRWRRRLIKDITRRDVLDLLDGIVAGGRPVAANRVLTAIRKMFSWAIERDIVASSPCAGVKPPTPEQSRDRVLATPSCATSGSRPTNSADPTRRSSSCWSLTGQRRDEVARMTWSEVDLEARLWTLPKERSKNGKPHDIPLSEPAVAILESLPRIGDTFVLTTNGKSAASNYGKQ